MGDRFKPSHCPNAAGAAYMAIVVIASGCAAETPMQIDSSHCWSLAFSPDGQSLAGGRSTHPSFSVDPRQNGTGHVDVWRTRDWSRAKSYVADLTSYAAGICFSRDGAVLYAASDKYRRPLGRGNPLSDTPNIITSWSVETAIATPAAAVGSGRHIWRGLPTVRRFARRFARIRSQRQSITCHRPQGQTAKICRGWRRRIARFFARLESSRILHLFRHRRPAGPRPALRRRHWNAPRGA